MGQYKYTIGPYKPISTRQATIAHAVPLLAQETSTSTKDTIVQEPTGEYRILTCGSTAPKGGPSPLSRILPVIAEIFLLALAPTPRGILQPGYFLILLGQHARILALHARRRTATLRSPSPRLRPRRVPHRYAKPPLDHIAATTTLHVPTTCAAPGFRAAVAFVCLLEAFFVGVAGKLTASQVPNAVAQRAAPLGSGAAGMKTLAPARAMPFRSQGMTSAAALHPLTLFLLLGPLVTSLVPGAVARPRRCRPGWGVRDGESLAQLSMA